MARLQILSVSFTLPTKTAHTNTIKDDNIGPGIWTFAEMSAAVIAACLPALKPLIDKLFPNLFSDDTPTVPWTPLPKGPRVGRPGAVSRAFNSLFSRWESREGEGRFFAAKDGRIVQLQSRFSRLSISWLEDDAEELKEKEGDIDGREVFHREGLVKGYVQYHRPLPKGHMDGLQVAHPGEESTTWV